MKIKSFLKLLNRKINKYDKVSSNPFAATPFNMTLVWVEDSMHYNSPESLFHPEHHQD